MESSIKHQLARDLSHTNRSDAHLAFLLLSGKGCGFCFYRDVCPTRGDICEDYVEVRDFSDRIIYLEEK